MIYLPTIGQKKTALNRQRLTRDVSICLKSTLYEYAQIGSMSNCFFYRTYNQHWLIQEAEQRRIAEQQQLQRPPPPSSQPSSITTPSSNDSHPMQQHGVGDGSPFYENSQYVNQRLIPSVPSQSPQHQQQLQSNYPPPVRGPHQPPPTHVPPPHVNENVYANLGSQQHPPHQQNPQPAGYQR